MTDPIRYAVQDGVAVLTVENPPVNALSQAVRAGIIAGLDKADADPAVSAAVIIGGGRTFIAGADIREFGKPPLQPYLPQVLERIEAMTKPVVAALHGTALGGGFEVALTCHWRVAVESGQVGLPEVKLGVIPGSGGTQRLPRLIGPKQALDMIVSGNPIPAKKALELGVLDEIVSGDLLEGAIAFAKKVVAEKRPLRLVRDLNDKVSNVDPAVFTDYRKSIERKAKGFLAPWRCIDAVEAACNLPIAEGLKKEREFFFECMDSPQRKAQIHAFFAEREAQKIPDLPADVKPRQIRSAAVIGAGTMGGGIAMNFANAGIPVKILEVSQEALARGLGVIEKNYATSVQRGSMKQEAMDRAMKLISGTQRYEDIGDADIVIEAVFEEMAVKKEVFGKLDKIMKPGAILATNTSTLDIDEIASATKRPQDVIGTHFFSPANVMRLLENVRGAKSSPETIATVMALGKTLKKVPVLAGNCDGFIGNRMLHGYLREASFLLEEGASPEQVDRALEEFGLAMGPFRMSDLAGLDVGWRIRKGKAHLRPKDERYSPVADRLCEMGRFGQKTGAGFYKYEGRNALPDPVVRDVILQAAKEQGIERRQISDEEIVQRCMYPLVNEGAKILEEGIAIRASDIDIVYLFGYGFPVYRGGPMFWAEQIGLDKVLATIRGFHKIHGKFWEPAKLLVERAEAGKGWNDR
ncbi:MAG TPA: 3-hydroxyacyl-CoA dehydrogenase NAD-binding domain-containing protein [Ferrovibrio sp.]|uniref:3-hydroxyacyl-CoA dehydrogenase NAD-binding domain-containing protein n=1 Tax=Ferrovibrio sp. TaxID=1917215 RepID=UPI002B4B3880|nr:3-hydroxyacyl-CoA dehydrogenase NAD-binding domain-containing protein [Ferrovibrio sp.]HLT77907.1 3-hydroxyacyl-CoA dehydrogenase NAD-binding domain-containing protein [Ferrovibrio sp.]